MKEYITLDNEKIPIPSYLSGHKPLFLKHIKAYQYLMGYVKDKRVLDVGCGYGYGTYLLSRKAKSVVGIDLWEKRIEGAKNLYKNIGNLEFKLLDAFKLDSTFPESSFDVIIAMEFIEHIQNPEKFLEISRKLLSINGLLILSTPNRLARGVEGTPWNPEHVQEFDKDSLGKLLSREFNKFKIIGMKGTEKFIKYNEIRTGGKTPGYIKRLWRYTPEILKKPVRKIIGIRLPEDITLEDFSFEDKTTNKHFTLIAFSEKK